MRKQRLDRAKLVLHKTLHPVEYRLKILTRAEIPRHGNHLSVLASGQPEVMEINLTQKCSPTEASEGPWRFKVPTNSPTVLEKHCLSKCATSAATGILAAV